MTTQSNVRQTRCRYAIALIHLTPGPVKGLKSCLPQRQSKLLEAAHHGGLGCRVGCNETPRSAPRTAVDGNTLPEIGAPDRSHLRFQACSVESVEDVLLTGKEDVGLPRLHADEAVKVDDRLGTGPA